MLENRVRRNVTEANDDIILNGTVSILILRRFNWWQLSVGGKNNSKLFIYENLHCYE